jgi:hypothetical protein
MRLPWLRRKPEKPRQPIPRQPAVDLTLPRRVFYRTLETSSGPLCPRCHETLVDETGVYLVTTWSGRQREDDFIISADFGRYCPACPTVVIDPNQLGEYVHLGVRTGKMPNAYAVLGLIDLEAIPEESRDVPFGELDELPLVPFEPEGSPQRPQKQRRRQSKARRKKRR